MMSKGFYSGGRSDMYRLRDLKNGLYQIHKLNGPAYEGTPRLVFTEAIKMSVKERDLVSAVLRLQKYNHDYADFDSKGRFVGTKKND